MTRMQDTGGYPLPLDNEGEQCWDISLNFDGKGYFAVSVPMFFEVEGGGEYCSTGVLYVELRDLLQEYLNDCGQLDDGDGLRPLAAMFREFAEKYEAACS